MVGDLCRGHMAMNGGVSETSRQKPCERQGCNQPTIATLYQDNLRGFSSTRLGEFWFQIVWQELRMSMAKEMEALKVA